MEKINWINGQSGGTPLSAENLNLMQDNAENAINEVSAILENKQNKWQTIWEGSATTGNVIDTGVDFTNIKGIRFAWGRGTSINNIFEPDIDAFFNGNQVETSYTKLEWNSLMKWADLALTLSNKVNGTITVDRSNYCYKYSGDTSFSWNNSAYASIKKIQINY